MPLVIIVGGPAGTGKTSVGALLAKHYNCPFVEGDDLHPQHNITKMSQGIPLTDDDRWGWLQKVSETASAKALDPENASHTVVASCSMLKKAYRDYLEKYGSGEFRFVFLHTTFQELMARVAARQGHYMKSDMVRSQYEIMEAPEGSELVENGGKAVNIETGDKTPEDIVAEVLERL